MTCKLKVSHKLSYLVQTYKSLKCVCDKEYDQGRPTPDIERSCVISQSNNHQNQQSNEHCFFRSVRVIYARFNLR